MKCPPAADAQMHGGGAEILKGTGLVEHQQKKPAHSHTHINERAYISHEENHDGADE